MTTKKSTAIISVVAASLAVIVGANQAWPIVGWTTPNQHDADIIAFTGDVKEFRDEWKCDEYEEELIELLKLQATGDNSIETRRKVERLREKIDKLNCQRFNDN